MSAYTDAYSAQVNSTPGLNPDPYAVQGSSGGVDYNFAGDPIVYGEPTNQSFGGGTTYTTSTTPTAPTSDPATQAYYDHQSALLNGQLGQLDTTQNVGLQNIGSSYNHSMNTLGDQYGRAQRDYNTGVQDTTQGYSNARDAAATLARNKLSAVQRLLGISGAGNSSASQDAVPLAVAQGASQDMAPVQTTYAQNRRNQDTNFGDTTSNFHNSQADLATQKYGQEQALKTSVAQTHMNLLNQIADAQYKSQIAGGAGYATAQAGMNAYGSQIDNLVAQIAQLGNQYQNPVMQTGAVNYQAPTLAQYLLGQQSQVSQTNPGGDSVNPLFLPLLGKQDKQLIGQ